MLFSFHTGFVGACLLVFMRAGVNFCVSKCRDYHKCPNVLYCKYVPVSVCTPQRCAGGRTQIASFQFLTTSSFRADAVSSSSDEFMRFPAPVKAVAIPAQFPGLVRFTSSCSKLPAYQLLFRTDAIFSSVLVLIRFIALYASRLSLVVMPELHHSWCSLTLELMHLPAYVWYPTRKWLRFQGYGVGVSVWVNLMFIFGTSMMGGFPCMTGVSLSSSAPCAPCSALASGTIGAAAGWIPMNPCLRLGG